MSETKFTPGPWRVLGFGSRSNGDRYFCLNVQQGQMIVEAHGGCAFNREADAALIAAAPEMYALLQKIVEIVGEAAEAGYTTVTGDRILEQGKAILQKARGEK